MPLTLIAGNWKMNGINAHTSTLKQMAEGVGPGKEGVQALICVPATLLMAAAQHATPSFAIGGQTCHSARSGAHTGDISAEMLADAGASHVIVGHSERRADHNESSQTVAMQAKAAIDQGLTAIICVGESLQQREAGETLDCIGGQIDASIPPHAAARSIVIAYEPIWAIGTGHVATVDQIAEVHSAIRSKLITRFGDDGATISILYGGSMKPDNAAEILAVPHVNGGLIGGASLKAEDFLSIYASAT